MMDEMEALHFSGTWELFFIPRKVGSWLSMGFVIKVGLDGHIDRLKARFVAKRYAQIFGLDYSDTFSPEKKMTSVHPFLATPTIQQCPLYQLDIENALHGDLQEVYKEQPPKFIAQGESGKV